MAENDGLAERFETNRSHLRAVAYRMLGSRSEADDAVQEAWIRLSRSDTSEVENLGGWLTAVVARVCLDMLRSRKARREDLHGEQLPEPIAGGAIERDVAPLDPEQQTLLADSVGPALLVVLETLAPPERLAFVLHDLFGMAFEEIAPIVGKSPIAARQLASRARRRVQGASTDDVDRSRQREIVDAFLAASRGGDFDALLAVLDPDVVLRPDAAAVRASLEGRAQGAPVLTPEVRGANAVAHTFVGRAQAAQRATVDGSAGAVWAPGGKPRVAMEFTVSGGKIVEIAIIAEPAHLGELELVLLDPAR